MVIKNTNIFVFFKVFFVMASLQVKPSLLVSERINRISCCCPPALKANS